LELLPMVGHFDQWAFDLMTDMSATAQRQLNWNLLTVAADTLDEAHHKLGVGTYARSRGAKVTALTMPSDFGIRMSLASGTVLDAIPGWERTMLQPYEERLAAFRDPAFRAELAELARRPGNPMGPVSDWSAQTILDVVAEENQEYKGRLVGDIAREQGRDPWDVLCDIALADDLRTGFGWMPEPATDDDWKARLEIWRDDRAVIGGSDAGAHVDVIDSFNYTTQMLAHSVRERALVPLEEAIHLLTDVPARLYGVTRRGRIEPGWHADVVVLDPETVASRKVDMKFDLPGGAGRLYAEADGIEHVFVNGTAIVRDGTLTGELPGRLLRSGVDTETAPLD
jgi:N-acyl-D-aspartate/D-glutamate deacylase